MTSRPRKENWTRSCGRRGYLASKKHALTAYADKVASGKVQAGALHRLACERHLADLAAKRFTFDKEQADRAVSFFPKVLRHYMGRSWAGKPIELEPWQQFVVGSLFGWRRADGYRRFQTAFVEVPRGNGKSTLAAGIAILGTFFDGESGAMSYCVATKKDQARIVWTTARQMVLASPGLRRHISPLKHSLVREETTSHLVPLGADADTLDGLRPQIVIADEVHAQKSGDLIEIMQTGMQTREQPILFEITTAGKERIGVWWQHREFSRQILEARGVEDDTWFTLIAAADEADDWHSPKTWAKANPNFGVSIIPRNFEAKYRQVEHMPADQPGFRRLYLGQLVESDSRVIDRAQWDACASQYGWESFVGRYVYAGLDLSSTTDLTACTWLTIDPDGKMRVWPQVWIPEAKLASHTDRVPYRTWAAQGWVTVTPGNVVDYEIVRAYILARAKTVKLLQLGFDPWSATETSIKLASELGDERVVEVRQGYVSMSEPVKRLLALLSSGMFVHPSSPLLTWTADNFTVAMDPAGNMKPDKSKARQRIDPMAALCNAIHLWLRQPVQTGSVYDRREVLVL
jgi:phage terminase large subunit-like protein